MTGTQGPPPLTGVQAIDDLTRKLAAMQATVDSLQASVHGPLRDWPYTRDPDGRPAVVAPDGTSHGLLSTTTDGRTIDQLAVQADEAVSRGLPEGWTFYTDDDDLLRVRDERGREFIMQESIGGWPAPMWAFGDSNTAWPSTVIPSVSTWPRLVSPSIQNAGVNGRGFVFVGAGQQSIEADIRSTPQPFGTAIINGGINDISTGSSAATIEGAITNAVIYASIFAQRVVVTTILPTTGSFAGLNTVRGTVNDWIRTTYSGAGPWASRVFALDIAGSVETSTNGPLAAGFSFDGLHLNQEGHNVVAQYFRSVLHLG